MQTNIHKLLQFTRFKTLVKYPAPLVIAPHLSKGQIGQATKNSEIYDFFLKYSEIFRQLEWYEERTISELLSVEFIEVVTYVGYDLVGDCLAVSRYEIIDLDTAKPKLTGYWANGRYYALEKVKPALSAKKL